MNKKILLTSFVALGFVCPAMAEPSYTGTFPANKLMQPDYAYTDAAIDTNMAGVYEGEVWAVAQYLDSIINVSKGRYLKAGSSSASVCESGYYCPGGDLEYSETSAAGLNQCPTGYNSSDYMANNENQCYRACSTSGLAHAATAAGKDYYGSGTDTCEPASCVNGWHIAPSANVKVVDGGINSAFRVETGENSAAIVESGANEYPSNLDSSYWGPVSDSFYGNRGKWLVSYRDSAGGLVLVGDSRRSSVSGVAAGADTVPTVKTTAELDAAGSGNNCYCSAIYYNDLTRSPNYSGSGPEYVYEVSNGDWSTCYSSWVYLDTEASNDDCAMACARKMREDYTTKFRETVFNNTVCGTSPAVCVGNQITIHWTGATSTQISANNAGTATYGGNINTPKGHTSAPSGKRFAGWKFFATEQ